MRSTSSQFPDVITAGSFSIRLVADVFYNDERTIVNLPVDPEDWSISWDAEQQTKFSGSLKVVYQGLNGDGIAASGLTDPLSPFGQEIALLMKISFGQIYNETILLGRFPIESIPTASDSWFGFQGKPFVAGSVVQLELVDLLDNVLRWGFRWPSVPTYTSSVWDELAYISGLPIAPNLTDRGTPADLVYQATNGGRLNAVQGLMSYLGGIAVVNSQGELTALPYSVGTPVLTLSMGPSATVIAIENSLESTELANEIVGTYQDDDGNAIWATALVTNGPLAYGGPYRKLTDYDSSDTVTDEAGAATRVRQVLEQRLQAHTVRYTIACVLDPRAEIGDFVQVNGPQALDPKTGALSAPLFTLTGRLISIVMNGSQQGLMTVVLDVGAALNAEITVNVSS